MDHITNTPLTGMDKIKDKNINEIKHNIQSKLQSFIIKKKLEIDKVAKDDREKVILQSYLAEEIKWYTNIKG